MFEITITSRVVIYSQDMEPITVVELSAGVAECLIRHRAVRLPVYAPVRYVRCNEAPSYDACTSVQLRADVYVKDNRRYMMITTCDEESALLLRSVFLPGQYTAVQERERRAFAEGFFEAFKKLASD